MGDCRAHTPLLSASSNPVQEAAASSGAPLPGATCAPSLRLGTLNVYYLRHPEDIADALRPHLPLDVLALQEVREEADAVSLAAALGMRVELIVEADDRVGLMNALLVQTDEPKGGSCASLILDHRFETRAALRMDLRRANLRFICTHLDHRDEDARIKMWHQLEASELFSTEAGDGSEREAGLAEGGGHDES